MSSSNYLKSLSNSLGVADLGEENIANQEAQTGNGLFIEEFDAGQIPRNSETPTPPQPPMQQAQQADQANIAPPNEAVEREDDWLSLLHNAVSFLILFCIVYYYSSFERLVVIFSIAFVLILLVF